MRIEELELSMARMIAIGTALSSERHLEVLLEMIVEEARRLSHADGGTLFLVDPQAQVLRWAIIQNETMGVRHGGRAAGLIDPERFRPIPLFDEQGRAAHENVATYAAHTGESIRIDDAYDEHDAFDFEGPIRFDAQTGYRTRSIMVVPLCHFEGGVIGVLQLINARDPAGHTIAFDARHEQLTTALASQAAVAVKNALLFEELEGQFEAFIQVIASAIDAKSPYTAGHVKRVVDVAMRIARALHEAPEGPYAEVAFSQDELKALHIASWMHDVGKIATPEHVIDKATKLQTLFDRLELVRERYARFRLERELAHAQAQIEALRTGAAPLDDEALRQELAALDEELAFLARCNQGGEFMRDEDLARLEQIARTPLMTRHGEALQRLSDDELENLSIRKGTLTWSEIEIIRDHARVSYAMLSQLPFSRHLKEVPEIAAGHHEKLNGKGYPRGLRAEQLSLPARILAIADIFEALTARDRPYKRPTPLSAVKRILDDMVQKEELDAELVTFAMKSGVFDAYAEAEVSEAQRDYRFSAVE